MPLAWQSIYGVACLLLWVSVLVRVAYLVTSVCFVQAGPRTRVVATLVVAQGVGTLTCLGLGYAASFDREVMTLLATVVGLATMHRKLRGVLAQSWACDGVRLRDVWTSLSLHTRIAASVAGGVVVARLLRTLVAPPMGTDALTYHLFKAGRWVQAGGFALEPAPDAWGYYAYYSPVGELPAAVTLLALHGDAAVGIASMTSWAGVTLGVFACARMLHAELEHACLAALAVAMIPAIAAFSTAAYVDNHVLALVTLGLALVGPALVVNDPRLGALALAGMGLAAAIKPTALAPLACLAAAGLAHAIARRDVRWLWAVIAGSMAALLFLAPGMIDGIRDFGNPLYPFAVPALGWRGNEENALLHAGTLAPAHVVRFELSALLSTLFVPRSMSTQHLNLGLSTPLLVVLGLVGAWSLRRQRQAQMFVVFGVVMTVVFIERLAGPGMLAHRTFASPAVGRFLLVPVGLWAALAAAHASPARARLLFVAVLLGAVWSFPRSWDGPELAALGELAVAVLLGGGIVAACIAAASRFGPFSAALRGHPGLVVVGLALVLAWPCAWIRHRHRYAFYAAAVDARSYDPHPVDARVAAMWPLWQALDAPEPSTVAYAAGWDGRGHNWYRYPLLGARLQNEVIYVPVSTDGHVFDYRSLDEYVAQLDAAAWMSRLRERDVDWLVLSAPWPIEMQWVQAAPQHFSLVLVTQNRQHALFRFRR